MKRIKEIKNEIIDLMKLSKKEMILAIANSAKTKNYTIVEEKSYGLVLDVELNKDENVIVAFNPGKNRPYKPCANTGTGKAQDLKNYVWIPVICELTKNNETRIFGYRIDFMCQDLDIETSNFHFNMFGGLQVWRNLIQEDSLEIGGSINPKPIKTEAEEYYNVKYSIQNAYPSSIRQNRNETEPWGYHFEQIPAFDMLAENFDMQKCADFILELIITDIKDKALGNSLKMESEEQSVVDCIYDVGEKVNLKDFLRTSGNLYPIYYIAESICNEIPEDSFKYKEIKKYIDNKLGMERGCRYNTVIRIIWSAIRYTYPDVIWDELALKFKKYEIQPVVVLIQTDSIEEIIRDAKIQIEAHFDVHYKIPQGVKDYIRDNIDKCETIEKLENLLGIVFDVYLARRSQSGV